LLANKNEFAPREKYLLKFYNPPGFRGEDQPIGKNVALDWRGGKWLKENCYFPGIFEWPNNEFEIYLLVFI